MKKSFIVIAVIIILIAAGYLYLRGRVERAPELMREKAAEILRAANILQSSCEEEGVEDEYRSCTVEIIGSGERREIAVIHDGFFDDSVRGSRIRVNAVWRDGKWKIEGGAIEEYRCWPGRGHEDFSPELCI